jgi:hypothetical protein
MAKIGFRGEALAGACLGGENAFFHFDKTGELLPAWNPNLIFTGNWDQQASNATTKALVARTFDETWHLPSASIVNIRVGAFGCSHTLTADDTSTAWDESGVNACRCGA